MLKHAAQFTLPVLAGLLFVLVSSVYAATPIAEHPQFKQAVEAYRAGQLDEAEQQ